MTKPISITHICESDHEGGAALAAKKLHTELRGLGADSRMVVARSKGLDPTISAVPEPPTTFGRLRNRLAYRFERLRLRPYKRTKTKDLEIFTTGRGNRGWDLVRALPDADVYQLHWSHQLINYQALFAHLGTQAPVAWRLPDMNALTGGCHYAGACRRFEDACGSCPQLGSQKENDLSRKVHRFRSVAYAQLNPELVRIIAPSAWIQGEARKSALLSNFDVVHIRTGVNGRLFSPKNRAKARQKLGLPLDAKVILTVAVDIESHRKGWNLLVQAVSKLQAKDVVVATVGQQSSASGDVKILKPLGRLQTEDELSEAYSAADLFVLPTREDNLPNVLLEAMACGTPCVSFDVGGVSEAIRHGETGLLAGPEDTDGLARAMDALLTDNALRERFGSQARALALAEFDAKALSAKYLELYETLAERARALATGESSRL